MSNQTFTTNEILEASGLLTHPEAYSVPEGVQQMIFSETGKRLSKSLIYALINDGRLPAKKLGTRTFVLREAYLNLLINLKDYVDENIVTKTVKKAHPKLY